MEIPADWTQKVAEMDCAIGLVVDGKVVYTKQPDMVFAIGQMTELFTTAWHATTPCGFSDVVSNLAPFPFVAEPFLHNSLSFADIYAHRSGFAAEDAGRIRFLSGYNLREILQAYDGANWKVELFRAEHSYQPALVAWAASIVSTLHGNKQVDTDLALFADRLGCTATSFADGDGFHAAPLTAALGGRSTVADLLKLLQLLLQDGRLEDETRLLPSVEELLQPHVFIAGSSYAALGWEVTYKYGDTFYFKRCILPTGQRGLLILSHQSRFGLVVLGQNIGALPEALFGYAYQLFVRQNVAVAQAEFEEALQAFGEYLEELGREETEGKFAKLVSRSQWPRDIDVSLHNPRNGALMLRDGKIKDGKLPAVPAVSYEDHVFRCEWPDKHGLPHRLQVGLLRDVEGVIAIGLVWTCGEYEVYKTESPEANLQQLVFEQTLPVDTTVRAEDDSDHEHDHPPPEKVARKVEPFRQAAAKQQPHITQYGTCACSNPELHQSPFSSEDRAAKTRTRTRDVKGDYKEERPHKHKRRGHHRRPEAVPQPVSTTEKKRRRRHRQHLEDLLDFSSGSGSHEQSYKDNES